MTRYFILYIILFAATVTPRSASAQAAKANHYAFNIQQALEYAKANNVQVKNALLNVQAQKETNREITAAALPNIFGTANVINYLQLPVSLLPGDFANPPLPPGSFIEVKFGTKYNSTAGIQLQQTLFDGQVFVGLQARKTSVDFQLKNVEVTEELIKANILSLLPRCTCKMILKLYMQIIKKILKYESQWNELIPTVSEYMKSQNPFEILCGVSGFYQMSLVYEFEIEAIIYAVKNNFKIQQVSIETHYYQKNASSHFKPIQDTIKIVKVMIKR
jgi:hypothetical protein